MFDEFLTVNQLIDISIKVSSILTTLKLMTFHANLERRGRIGVLTINNPPVNALSAATVAQMMDAFSKFDDDKTLGALVIHGVGRTFVAGGDISSFDAPDFTTAKFNAFLSRIEASQRLVVATMHGTALGGGLELALACHYRIAVPSLKLGLPEVKLGIIPGSLGTQRLPRVAGAKLALDMIQSGRMIGAVAALDAGILDEVQEGDPLQLGLDYAQLLLERQTPVRRVSDFTVNANGLEANFFPDALSAAMNMQQYPALAASVRCVEAATTLSFAEGERVEAREFEQLRVSKQSKAQRHLFFAEREATKIPGLPKSIPLRSISRVGIIGAGVMGGGIAMNFANVGIETVLVDAQQEALERGLTLVRKNYEASVKKGKLSADELERRMRTMKGTLDYAALADCDLVIEAAFEDMALKMQICARLGAVCKPNAIIATNTSTLDVNQLAEATGRPEDVVGMHFFSPANVMRLLEVVRAKHTTYDVLATVMQLAKRIGKTAVVSGVCYGFIGNRMAEVYGRESELLLLSGATPAQIDKVVQSPDQLGLAMGPCRMLDMAGVDVGAKTVIEWIKSGGAPKDPAYRIVCRTLYEQGHHGQKTGLGYYRYEGRTPIPATETTVMLDALAHKLAVVRRKNIDDQEILERLLYPMINEAARILEEGIAYRPGDIDVVWTAGYGFPNFRGGPVFMADEIGIDKIVERLDHYAQADDEKFGYWKVSPLLRRLMHEGRRLSDWTSGT